MLYAETKEERHLWMKRIKANINRLSNCSHYCSPDFCSLDWHHHHHGARDNNSAHGHQALMSVLDRWLNKLDLYDGSDDDSDYFPKQPSTTSSSPNHSRSNSSSVGGHSSSSSSSTPKHKSTESIGSLVDYSSSSMYSESASTMTPSMSNASGFNSGHHRSNRTRRQHATPIKHHHHHHPARQQDSSPPAGHGGNYINTHQSLALPLNTTQITKLLSIESERLKYAETTLQYYQHPHIHRSTSTKFRSELGISLSPPPPRR